MASAAGDRVVALSVQLTQAHRQLRRQVDEVKSGLGARPFSDDRLRTHCLAFCDALAAHHQGEDDGMFAQLRRARPDLAPTLAKLVEDHTMITGILARVRDLADQAADARGAALTEIGGELDGLTAIMESHFRYEERTISRALDDLAADRGDGGGSGWYDAVFGQG